MLVIRAPRCRANIWNFKTLKSTEIEGARMASSIIENRTRPLESGSQSDFLGGFFARRRTRRERKNAKSASPHLIGPRDSKSRPRTVTVGITSQKSHETTEFCVYPILNNRRCLEILASYFCFNKRRKKRSSDSLFQWILLYFFESEQPWGP